MSWTAPPTTQPIKSQATIGQCRRLAQCNQRFDYTPQFRQAVDQAAIAKTLVERAEQLKRQAEIDAESKKITAIGEANAVREDAAVVLEDFVDRALHAVDVALRLVDLAELVQDLRLDRGLPRPVGVEVLEIGARLRNYRRVLLFEDFRQGIRVEKAWEHFITRKAGSCWL